MGKTRLSGSAHRPHRPRQLCSTTAASGNRRQRQIAATAAPTTKIGRLVSPHDRSTYPLRSPPMKNTALWVMIAWLPATLAIADETLPVISVEGQPLAANIRRLIQALDVLGPSLPADATTGLLSAAKARDHSRLQTLLDRHVLLVVAINPESRVKVLRGPAPAQLQQGGYTPVVIKIINESTITKRLRVVSQQAGPVYAGVAALSL